MDKEFNIQYLLKCLLKKTRLIAFFVCTGVVVGIIVSFFYTPTYQTVTLISAPRKNEKALFPFSTINSLVENINKEIENKSYINLARYMSIPPEKINKIENVKIDKLSKNNDIFLKLIIQAKDRKCSVNFSNSLLNYLKKQRFIKNRLTQERNFILQTLSIYKKQLANLEQTVRDTKKQLLSSNGKTNFIGFNPANLDISIANVKEKIKSLQYMLNNTRNFEVIETHTEKSPLSASKKGIIIICGFLGLLVGIIITTFKFCSGTIDKEE
ncbi:Wzz/FepE/Etk N-terminal domain-containing protein [Desulfurobacterium sp.]